MSSSYLTAKYHYSIIAVIFPAVDSCHNRLQSLVGHRDGVLTALAMEVYRRKHGQWPVSLDQMVPDILPSVPRDRITGDPLRFRAVNGQAVVYSVGQDLDDDGGVLAAAQPVDFHEVFEGASEERIEQVRKANEKLRNETPRERSKRTVNATGPSGRHGDRAKDGDWILWHSTDWPAERAASKPKQGPDS